MKILAINPGSTSTKIAIFDDEQDIFRHEIQYSPQDFADCATVMAQRTRRAADIRTALAGFAGPAEFDAVVGRGGLIGPVAPGGYLVDENFLDAIVHRPVLEHAANLGGPLAALLAAEYGKPAALALVYDPVTIDEMAPVSRLTGVPGVERKSIGHHLNMRAVARQLAAKIDRPFTEAQLIVAHLGGGSTACALAGGQVVDFVSDDEIQFSAERSGGVPVKEVLALAASTPLDALKKDLRQRSGLAGLLGTTDLRVVEERIDAGDERAALVFAALALQIAKAIATLAVSLNGRVEAIGLTGGMAHSARLLSAVGARVDWVAPVHGFGGEFEMAALAAGALRILRSQEAAHRIGAARATSTER